VCAAPIDGWWLVATRSSSPANYAARTPLRKFVSSLEKKKKKKNTSIGGLIEHTKGQSIDCFLLPNQVTSFWVSKRSYDYYFCYNYLLKWEEWLDYYFDLVRLSKKSLVKVLFCWFVVRVVWGLNPLHTVFYEGRIQLLKNKNKYKVF